MHNHKPGRAWWRFWSSDLLILMLLAIKNTNTWNTKIGLSLNLVHYTVICYVLQTCSNTMGLLINRLVIKLGDP